MTLESQMARDLSVHFEAKKDGLKQVQSGDVKVTLTVAAQDMPSSLYSDVMGQRYIVAVVPIGDDEKPTDTKKPKSYAGQAKMMAKDEDFQKFVSMSKGQSSCYGEGEAEQWIEYSCNVKSCSELIEGTEAGRRFKSLQRKFLQWRDS